MIKLTNHVGVVSFVATTAIAKITVAGASSQWHGIRSFVKLFDGETLECRETASEIHAAIEGEAQ